MEVGHEQEKGYASSGKVYAGIQVGSSSIGQWWANGAGDGEDTRHVVVDAGYLCEIE